MSMTKTLDRIREDVHSQWVSTQQPVQYAHPASDKKSLLREDGSLTDPSKSSTTEKDTDSSSSSCTTKSCSGSSFNDLAKYERYEERDSEEGDNLQRHIFRAREIENKSYDRLEKFSQVSQASDLIDEIIEADQAAAVTGILLLHDRSSVALHVHQTFTTSKMFRTASKLHAVYIVNQSEPETAHLFAMTEREDAAQWLCSEMSTMSGIDVGYVTSLEEEVISEMSIADMEQRGHHFMSKTA
jgi:hypothetical protein